jgi:hypothetical protein
MMMTQLEILLMTQPCDGVLRQEGTSNLRFATEPRQHVRQLLVHEELYLPEG